MNWLKEELAKVPEENRKEAQDYLEMELAKVPADEMVTLTEKMSKSEIVIGEKTFTAQRLVEEALVKEAEERTDEGNMFLDMIYGSFLENAKKDEGENQRSR